MANDVTIRLIYRDSEGAWQDGDEAFDLGSFAGYLPQVGDTILDPGVVSNLDRLDPKNRRLWKVVDRVFNARDFPDTVALIVEERSVSDSERSIIA